MRVMVIVKANEASERGEMPSQELLEAMTAYNEELVKAGLMLAGDGLHPSSKGVRVHFDGKSRTVRPVPQPLLAIPVLEVELNADGSVRRIVVQRQPSQARDTVQLAIDAVQRAAPFGDVSHLPRPWKFSEVFLFRDDRRFKPRALDL